MSARDPRFPLQNKAEEMLKPQTHSSLSPPETEGFFPRNAEEYKLFHKQIKLLSASSWNRPLHGHSVTRAAHLPEHAAGTLSVPKGTQSCLPSTARTSTICPASAALLKLESKMVSVLVLPKELIFKPCINTLSPEYPPAGNLEVKKHIEEINKENLKQPKTEGNIHIWLQIKGYTEKHLLHLDSKANYTKKLLNASISFQNSYYTSISSASY